MTSPLTLMLLSLVVAMMLVNLLLVMSISALNRTGPAIKERVLKTFRWFSVRALLRQGVLTLLVLTLLALPGQMAIFGWFQMLSPQSITDYSISVGLIGGAASIILLLSLLIMERLLYNPASIIVNSPYSPERWGKINTHLSPKRVWIAVSLVAVLLLFGILLFIDAQASIERKIQSFLLILPTTTLLVDIFTSRLKHQQYKPKSKSHPDVRSCLRKNIIMLGCDTLRADRIGRKRNGKSLTPNLDTLAKHSTVYKNAYVPVARTAPSLVSLFTGRWPHETGVCDNFDLCSDLKQYSLISQLNSAGYTSTVISDWAGSDFRRFDFGFKHKDTPNDQWNLKYMISQGSKELRQVLGLFSHGRLGKLLMPELHYLAGVPQNDALTARTISKLHTLAAKPEPFIVNTFFSSAHPPFGSEYPYYRNYTDRAYQGPSKLCMAKLTDPDEIIKSQRDPKECFDLGQITDLYDGCVAKFDQCVGNIINYLEQAGLADSTLLVVYADHGIDFFEHNTWGQGNTVDSTHSYHIPLFIRYPGEHKKEAIETPVRSIDIAPTIAEFAGIPLPHASGQPLPKQADALQPVHEYVYYETGIWLSRPPLQPSDHLHYPELAEILDAEQDGTLFIKPQYHTRILEARDCKVKLGDWELSMQPFQFSPHYELRYRQTVISLEKATEKYEQLVQILHSHHTLLKQDTNYLINNSSVNQSSAFV